MAHRFPLIVLLLTLLSVSAASAPQAGGGSIRGTVTALKGTSDVVVPMAEVTLMIPAVGGAGAAQRQVVTDSNGRFEFSGLQPANYTIQARAAGYYASLSPDGPVNDRATTGATVGPQRPNATLTLRLNKTAVIRGRLKDPDGRPVTNVKVVANRLVYRYGQATLATMEFALLASRGGTAQTDDRGEYRLFGLPAGAYYISADSGARTEFAKLTYYPGTADTSLIQGLVVKDGDEVTVDFSMARPSPYSVSGKVILPVEVRGARGIALYLASRNALVQDSPSIVQNAGSGQSQDGSEQRFEVRGIQPGKYELFAIAPATAPPPINDVAAVARIPFEIAGRSIEGLAGVAELPKTLRGRVVAKAPGMRVDSVNPFLQPLQNMPSVLRARPGPIPVAPDGTFVIDGLYPATYLAGLTGSIPSRAYVSDVRIGGRSVYPSNAVTVDSGTIEPLEFTLDAGTTTIAGTALDRQQQPVVGVRVVLVPEQPARNNVRLYQYGSSAQNGAFRFSNVAPGEYKVFVWEESIGAREHDPGFLAGIEPFGQRLTVRPSAPVAGIRVQMIPKQQ